MIEGNQLNLLSGVRPTVEPVQFLGERGFVGLIGGGPTQPLHDAASRLWRRKVQNKHDHSPSSRPFAALLCFALA